MCAFVFVSSVGFSENTRNCKVDFDGIVVCNSAVDDRSELCHSVFEGAVSVRDLVRACTLMIGRVHGNVFHSDFPF